MKVLLHGGKAGGERRPLYFLSSNGDTPPIARIISFGACNFACPYCKRDGQFRAADGTIVSAIEIDIAEIFAVCEKAIQDGEVVRLSGGDPVAYPRESLAIARFCAEKGAKISMAHNGSSPDFAHRMSPYLSSAAIDLKAGPHELGKVAGIGYRLGLKMFERSLEVQRILSLVGVLVDVRTPIFGTTTLDDMFLLADHIAQNEVFWTWRLYKPVEGCDWLPPVQDTVVWMVEQIKLRYPELRIGLRAKWEPSGFLYF